MCDESLHKPAGAGFEEFDTALHFPMTFADLTVPELPVNQLFTTER